jgi:REP element-mobilizing transposase RayT
LDLPGAPHHVMGRGIARTHLFLDELDRNDFLDRLEGLCSKKHLLVMAWALMQNCFHLLVRSTLWLKDYKIRMPIVTRLGDCGEVMGGGKRF